MVDTSHREENTRPEQRLKASEAELEATKSYAVCVHRLP